MQKISKHLTRNWRRGWDSNPRRPCGLTAFRVRRTRPGYATSPEHRLWPNWNQTRNLNGNLPRQKRQIQPKMSHSARDPAMSEFVCPQIVLYAFLALADFGLTLAAFGIGLGEANPVLNSFAEYGLFEAGKLALTLLVCCVAFKMQNRGSQTIAFGNALMIGVIVYHAGIWAV